MNSDATRGASAEAWRDCQDFVDAVIANRQNQGNPMPHLFIFRRRPPINDDAAHDCFFEMGRGDDQRDVDRHGFEMGCSDPRGPDDRFEGPKQQSCCDTGEGETFDVDHRVAVNLAQAARLMRKAMLYADDAELEQAAAAIERLTAEYLASS